MLRKASIFFHYMVISSEFDQMLQPALKQTAFYVHISQLLGQNFTRKMFSATKPFFCADVYEMQLILSLRNLLSHTRVSFRLRLFESC